MEFIIDAKPILKDVDKMKFYQVKRKLLNNEVLSKSEQELFLDFYVAQVRKALETGLGIDIESDPLINKCDLAQKLIGLSLEKVSLTVNPQETHKSINPTVPGHSFLTVVFNDGTPYLIDLTYRQFFIKENCNIDRLQIVDDLVVLSPDPGFFVNQSEELTETAVKILERGYVLLDETTAKHYGDSFYFTKRDRGPYSNIPGKVYMSSFLKESKNYSMSDESLKETGFKM